MRYGEGGGRGVMLAEGGGGGVMLVGGGVRDEVRGILGQSYTHMFGTGYNTKSYYLKQCGFYF